MAARVDGKSRDEIAAQFKLTPVAVKRRLARAYKRLSLEQRTRYFRALHPGRKVRIRPLRLSFVDNV